MDVSICKQSTGRNTGSVFFCLGNDVAVGLIATLALFVVLASSSIAVVHAAQIIPPMPSSNWGYSYVRCNTYVGPYETELEAATVGMNNTYGACGDPYVSDWGRWGTLAEGVAGACGSTNYHPKYPNDYSFDVEVYNNRQLKISYCDSRYRDGLTLKRVRTAGCPAGYSGNSAGTCTLSGVNLLKTAGQMCPLVANPLYPGTGNKYQREVDHPGDDVGSTGFVRHYNSRVAYAGIVHAVRTGRGWSNTYTRQVNYFSNRGISVATVLRPDGKAYYFILDATTNSWNADEDVKSQLEQLIDGAGVRTGWRYRTANDVVENYNEDGLLQTITDLQGRIRTLTYDTQNPDYPSRVDSNTGEYLKFTYNSKNRLAFLEDQAARTWGYRYDGIGNLEFVDNPDGTTRQYHYEDSSNPNGLTGITDERGYRYATYEYQAAARVTASYHGPQTTVLTDRIQGVSISYHADGSRTLTNSNGESSSYSTLNQSGVSLITASTGPGCTTCGTGESAYVYDPLNNNLLSRTENGITTEYGDYDADGNPGYMIEAKGTPEQRRTDYSYDPRFKNKILTITGPSVFPGSYKVTTYSYDDYGNRIAERIDGYTPAGMPVSRSTTRQFDGPLQQLSRIDGPRTDVSDVTHFRYYTNDILEGSNRARLKEVEDASGVLIRKDIRYTASGKIASENRPDSLGLSYSYYPGNDRLETLVQSSGSGSRVNRWTYLPTGEVESVTAAEGTADATTIVFAYDEARRLTRITDGLGSYIEYSLDTEGNHLSEETYDSAATLRKSLTQTFDIYNRLNVTSQVNEIMDYDFSPNGTLAQQTDGKGTVGSFSYDGLNRLLASTQDLGGIDAMTQYGYDVSDNLTSVTDPANGNTRYEYDDLGNLVKRISPDSGTVVFSYDAAGDLTVKQDALGGVFVYSYDDLNRLTGVDAPGTADDVDYSYDNCVYGSGRLCAVVSTGVVVAYGYDAFGNVATHQQIAYSHDGADRVKTITYPSGAVVSFSYDAAGQVSQVDLNANGNTTTLASNISYVPFGPVENFLFGNGATLTQEFDAAYRLISQQIPGFMDLGYLLYDPNGNLMTRTDSFSSTATFNYDVLDRLVTGAGSFGYRDYAYDLNGNRTFLDDGSITNYEYSTASNRLLSETGWTYTVDSNGNTTKKINVDGEGRIYTYDSHNRLVTVSNRSVTPAKGKNKLPVITDTVIAVYNYNGLGQRTSKAVDGAGKQFLYGTDGALMAELDMAGVAQREYIYLNSQLLAVLDHGSLDTSVPEETIVDNGAAPAGWVVNTSSKDYGNGYLYSDGDTGNAIRWTPGLAAGSYEVYAWYVKSKKYSASVPYTVVHGGQADTMTVDQSTGGSAWLLLGTYSFDGSGNEYVEVSDTTGKTTADAIRFVNVGGGQALTTTTLSYVHNDHLGTPQVMTNKAGNVVWRATYDPFGAATVDPSSTAEMNVRFPGQYFDQEAGLHYNYFRYYDPFTGRYITSDPIGLDGGSNTFAYAWINPVRYTDEFGLFVKLCSRKLGSKNEPATSENNILRHDFLNVSGTFIGFQAGDNPIWGQGRVEIGRNIESDGGRCHTMICSDDKFDQYVFDAARSIPRPTYCVLE